MKASEIVADARTELIEANASFFSDAELLRYVNQGQMDFVRRTKVLEDKALLTLQEGRAEYPLPSNWLSVRAIFHNRPQADGSADWRRLYPKNLEKVAQERPNFLDTSATKRDRPAVYWIWGKSIYFEPSANAENISDSNVCLFFKAKPVTLTSATQDLEIDDSLCFGVTEYVLWKAWAKDNERQKAADHFAAYLDSVKEGLKWVKRQSGDARNRFDIESGFGFSSTSYPSGINPF